MAAILNRAKTKAIPSRSFNWGRPGESNHRLPRAALWESEVFHDIETAVGKERAKSYLETYSRKLDEIADNLSRKVMPVSYIRNSAHDVKSMSGQLGFQALSEFSAWIMVQPDAVSKDSNTQAWLVLIQESSDAARLYAHRNFGRLC